MCNPVRLLNPSDYSCSSVVGDGTHHFEWCQNQDDVSDLAAVFSPVLWSLQTRDANVTSLQMFDVTATKGTNEEKVKHTRIYTHAYTHIHTHCFLQDAEPGLLVLDACGCGRHPLDGLWQQVNCGAKVRGQAQVYLSAHVVLWRLQVLISQQVKRFLPLLQPESPER